MDYEVVSDSLRQKRPHRGKPTPQYIEDLLEGKTLRLPTASAARTAVQTGKKLGRAAHQHMARDGKGGYIVWYEKEPTHG